MAKWTTQLPMPGAYFELALRVFGTTPDLEAALREGTGEARKEADGDITVERQLQQARNLNRIGPPGWGLALGSHFQAATHGALGFATVSAPALGDSLGVIERFGHVRAPYLRFRGSREAQGVVLAVEERIAVAPAERVPLIESTMLSLQLLVESVLGRPMHDATFELGWPRPGWADEYPTHFHGTVRFDAPRTALVMPDRWLALRCPMADAGMYEASLRTLQAMVRRLESDDYVVARIEQLVEASAGNDLSLAHVSRRLRLSSRTLIRRLRGAGTTYHELIDAHRRERAATLLANPDYGVAEVSHLLGYGDPANFGRACRRWFGMAPGAYRRRLRA